MSEEVDSAKDLVFKTHQRIQKLFKVLETDVRDTEKIEDALDEIEQEDITIFQEFKDVDEWLDSQFTEDYGDLNEEEMKALKENILVQRDFEGGIASNLQDAADMLEEEAERMREEAVRVRELTNQIRNDLRDIRSYGH